MLLELTPNVTLLVAAQIVERAESDSFQLEYVNHVLDMISKNADEFRKIGIWMVVFGIESGAPVLKFSSHKNGVVSILSKDQFADVSKMIDFTLFNFSGDNPANLILTEYSEAIWLK